jgi:hypothetical protein
MVAQLFRVNVKPTLLLYGVALTLVLKIFREPRCVLGWRSYE